MSGYDLTVYEYLRPQLRLCKLTTDQSETLIRCPYCGDSLREDHAHFYINNKPPFKYYCQKCTTSGIVDNKFLNRLKVYDSEIINYVKQTKKEYIKSLNKKYGDDFLHKFDKPFDVLPDHFDRPEKLKLKYIEKRLGITIDTEESLSKYKIILNLQDFFNKNNLKMNEFYKKNLKMLQNKYVGFLLNDNNMITFRHISYNENNNEMRYINKKIYSEHVFQSRKFYTISNTIDLSRSIYNIYLAEGIFDIMGIHNHIYDCKQEPNDIFVACCGKSYDFVLNYLQSLGILNCDINIYSDKDVNKESMLKLIHNNNLTKYNGAILYYNQLGKDYGVTKNEISLTNGVEIL